MSVGKTVLTGGGLGLGALAGYLLGGLASATLGVEIDDLGELGSAITEAFGDSASTHAEGFQEFMQHLENHPAQAQEFFGKTFENLTVADISTKLSEMNELNALSPEMFGLPTGTEIPADLQDNFSAVQGVASLIDAAPNAADVTPAVPIDEYAMTKIIERDSGEWIGGLAGGALGALGGNRIARGSEQAAQRQQAANFQAQVLASNGIQLSPEQYAAMKASSEQASMVDQLRARGAVHSKEGVSQVAQLESRDAARGAQPHAGPSPV